MCHLGFGLIVRFQFKLGNIILELILDISGILLLFLLLTTTTTFLNQGSPSLLIVLQFGHSSPTNFACSGDSLFDWSDMGLVQSSFDPGCHFSQGIAVMLV